MKTLALAWACGAILALAGPAGAQTAQFGACMDKADGLAMMHNTARLACIEAELKIQDAALNAAYRTGMAKLPPELKPKMMEAQRRAWVRFRDADCSFESALEIPLSPSLCIMLRTKDRAEELAGLATPPN
jgi:uncharacterized protein YecT (DUF1311 family)